MQRINRGSALLESVIAVALVGLLSSVLLINNSWREIHIKSINRNLEPPKNCTTAINQYQLQIRYCLNTGPQI